MLLTISVPDLLQQTAAQREMHAGILRQRLEELHQELGIRFPIYVLITKADLLAGFAEYFQKLGAEERAQVWGATFPYNDAKEAKDKRRPCGNARRIALFVRIRCTGKAAE